MQLDDGFGGVLRPQWKSFIPGREDGPGGNVSCATRHFLFRKRHGGNIPRGAAIARQDHMSTFPVGVDNAHVLGRECRYVAVRGRGCRYHDRFRPHSPSYFGDVSGEVKRPEGVGPMGHGATGPDEQAVAVAAARAAPVLLAGGGGQGRPAAQVALSEEHVVHRETERTAVKLKPDPAYFVRKTRQHQWPGCRIGLLPGSVGTYARQEHCNHARRQQTATIHDGEPFAARASAHSFHAILAACRLRGKGNRAETRCRVAGARNNRW